MNSKRIVKVLTAAIVGSLTLAAVAMSQSPDGTSGGAKASSLRAASAPGNVASNQAYEQAASLAGEGGLNRPAASNLAPREESRVLREDRLGKLSVIPTKDDTGYCYVLEAADGQGDHGGCLKELGHSGIGMILAGTLTMPSASVVGIAADNVSSVDLTLKSGKVKSVDVIKNAFFAKIPSSDLPTKVTTVFTDGSTIEQTAEFSLIAGPVPRQAAS